MKEKFRGWYPRSVADLREIWSRATFVPDANILLHMLRHSQSVRDRLVQVFEANKGRVWIPYQVGLEFHRNRPQVERQAFDAYDKIGAAAQRAIAGLEQSVKEMRAHPYIDVESEFLGLKRHLKEIETRMESLRSAHDSALMVEGLERVSALFAGRVGERLSAQATNQIRKEADERFPKKIPPGYKDVSKGPATDEKYGDYIIWKEMIDLAKSGQQPVIFITDDVKEDWWQIDSGRKMGPRPELIDEFFELTSQPFHMYTLPEFLRHAAEDSGLKAEDLKLVQESIHRDMEAKATVENSALAEQQRALVLGAHIRSLSATRDSVRANLLAATGDRERRTQLKQELTAIQQELETAQREMNALVPDLERADEDTPDS